MNFLSKLGMPSREEALGNTHTTVTPSQKDKIAPIAPVTNFETSIQVALKDCTNMAASLSKFLKTQPSTLLQTTAVSKEKNEVRYSADKIVICRSFIDDDGSVNAVEIPKKGFFRAGPKLLRQIEEELFEIMVSETIKAQENGDDATKQQRVDQGRNTATVLKNPSSSPQENKSPTLGEINQFFKSDSYNLSLPAGSILNQTLGHICLLLYSQALLPNLHEQKTEGHTPLSFECFDATGAMGFPLALMSKTPTHANLFEEKTARVEYEAEKIHPEKGKDAFLIKYTQEAQSLAFYLRDKKDSPTLTSERPSQEVLLDDSITQSSLTTIEIKLAPNPHFNKERPWSRENFPCLKPECLSLENKYTTEEKPQ